MYKQTKQIKKTCIWASSRNSFYFQHKFDQGNTAVFVFVFVQNAVLCLRHAHVPAHTKRDKACGNNVGRQSCSSFMALFIVQFHKFADCFEPSSTDYFPPMTYCQELAAEFSRCEVSILCWQRLFLSSKQTKGRRCGCILFTLNVLKFG